MGGAPGKLRVDGKTRYAREMVKSARAVAMRAYKVPTGQSPLIEALLRDLDRGDGVCAEYERTAAELGVDIRALPGRRAA